MTSLLAERPAKRAVERYWLRYTLVWGSVVAVIMVTGQAARWGDAELMVLGVVLALGAVVPPVLRPHESERTVAVTQRTAFRLGGSVVGYALLMNYFCTPYFFDVLHMHFGFDTTINIQNNPVFLYFMTVAYFATYSVMLCASFRASRRLPVALRGVGGAVAPFAVAFLETLLNANPFTASVFCFDDPAFMLWFGTLSYGSCFVFILPVWLGSDERTPSRGSTVAVGVLASMMAIAITFELLRHLVAPHVTTVSHGDHGFRDFDTSCLESP